MKFVSGLLLVAGLAAVNAATSGRILGGANAPQGSANYHAHLLLRQNQNSPTTNVGSGTLISTSHVLTSATNTQNFGWFNIGLGSLNRAQLQWQESTRAVTHPEFNADLLNNNIGIIFLAQPIVPSATLIPATMPTMAQASMPMTNESGRVSGFGFTHITGNFATDLQMSFQRVTDTNECLAGFPHLQSFMQNVFCGDSNQGNICAGDQGAGFVIDVFFQPVLLGVASFTSQDCRNGAPAVYTRVNQYRNWIQQQTGIQW